jgi:iron complex transport system substrate-binding protein
MKSMLTFLLIFSCVIQGFSQNEQRIITAGSAMTETICALGLCDKIIASDRTSLYPAKIQELPSIGYRTNISAEGIISLKPTLVIAEEFYVEETVLAQIRAAGIKLISIPRSYSLDGTKNLIREISLAVNKKKEGEVLITKIQAQIAEANAIIKKSKVTPKVLCIYNRGTAVDAAGTKTFSEILPYVGAVSAIAVEGYKPLNAEAMIAANPDYILFFESGLQSLGGLKAALEIQGVLHTTAGKRQQILAMDGIKLSNFGPRFGEAVKELTLLIHPDVK